MRTWKKILVFSLAAAMMTSQNVFAAGLISPSPISSVGSYSSPGNQGSLSGGPGSGSGGTVAVQEAPGSNGSGTGGSTGNGTGSPGSSGNGTGSPGSTGNGTVSPGSSGNGSGSPGAASEGPGSSSGGPASKGPGTGTGSSGGASGGPGAGGAGTSITTVTTTPSPVVRASGAALYNVTTGQFVYSKDGDGRYYPASITKLMTALLTAENCSLDDTVTFSETAVSNLESGAVTLKLAAGDQLTVRQSLYGLMLKSANEVANGLAEKVSGSVSAFAGKMNERAKAIGCTGTNFMNPNGLNNDNHYTTPHDMALIGAEAFKNATVAQVASTLSYEIPATKKAAARTVTMGDKMLYPGNSQYYQGIVGGKTGYTSKAGNTLVTCAERNGTRLVAVVMKSSMTHYQDTKAMLDYGFTLAANPTGRWMQNSTGWYFLNTDNSYPAGQWMNINGYYYWFESSGYMATGWKQLNGTWYYLKPGGEMAANYWAQSNGNWYYLGANGAMMTNTTTPDGYRVDGNGIWVR